MPRVMDEAFVKQEAEKIGLTGEELGQLIKPLWMLLYDHGKTEITITREGLRGGVRIT